MHRRCSVLAAISLLVGACSNGGDGSALPELAAQPSSASPEIEQLQLPEGPLSGSAIKTVLAGRTWNYESATYRGTITFNADGTIDYEQSGEGRGTGRWHVAGSKLCESFDPGPVIPKGRKAMCFPFRRAGSDFYAGSTRLTLANS